MAHPEARQVLEWQERYYSTAKEETILTAEERLVKKAMKALDVRTPMSVKWSLYMQEYDPTLADSWVEERVRVLCPRCESALYDFSSDKLGGILDEVRINHYLYECMGEMHFCPNCGQKLSWKHAEEV